MNAKNTANVKPNTDSPEIAALKAQLAEANKQNALLKEKAAKAGEAAVSLKVSESGCISMYGLGRYPTTLRALTKQGTWEGSQWQKVVAITGGDGGKLKAFVEANMAAIKANTARHNAAKGTETEGAL